MPSPFPQLIDPAVPTTKDAIAAARNADGSLNISFALPPYGWGQALPVAVRRLCPGRALTLHVASMMDWDGTECALLLSILPVADSHSPCGHLRDDACRDHAHHAREPLLVRPAHHHWCRCCSRPFHERLSSLECQHDRLPRRALPLSRGGSRVVVRHGQEREPSHGRHSGAPTSQPSTPRRHCILYASFRVRRWIRGQSAHRTTACRAASAC